MHACTELCIYEGCERSFALTCAVLLLFSLSLSPAYTTMRLPVGTSSMNVDIVRFVFPPKVFSRVPALPSRHRDRHVGSADSPEGNCQSSG